MKNILLIGLLFTFSLVGAEKIEKNITKKASLDELNDKIGHIELVMLSGRSATALYTELRYYEMIYKTNIGINVVGFYHFFDPYSTPGIWKLRMTTNNPNLDLRDVLNDLIKKGLLGNIISINVIEFQD